MYKNLAAALAAACCFSSRFFPTRAASRDPLKIGFVYVAPVTDAGWVRQHEEGRKAVEAALGGKVKTTYVENVRRGRRCRARDPRPRAAGQQADLHAQLRLHGADAEGGARLSRT